MISVSIIFPFIQAFLNPEMYEDSNFAKIIRMFMGEKIADSIVVLCINQIPV